MALFTPLVSISLVQNFPIPALAVLAFTLGYFTFAWLPPFIATLFELPKIRPKEIAAGQAFSMTISALSFAFSPVVVGTLADGPAGSLRVALMLSTFGPIGVFIAGLLVRETGRRSRLKSSQ